LAASAQPLVSTAAVFNHSSTMCGLSTACLKKTGPLRLSWHNFTSSQCLLIILVGRDLIQFSIDNVKTFQIGLEPAAQFP